MKKFDGPIERLRELVAATGLPGEWNEIEHGHQFRAKSGANLNWYPSTGTVSYGGPGTAKAELVEMLAAVAGDPLDTAPTTTARPVPVPTRISSCMDTIILPASNWSLFFSGSGCNPTCWPITAALA